jgi:monofunctional biosynthetic peptidoglycan transglycosylase
MKKKKGGFRFLWIVTAASALLLIGVAVVWFSVPDVRWLSKRNPGETSLMKFRRAQALEQKRKAGSRWQWIPLARISPYLIQAVLISEDDKFFEHEGFDWESIRQALEVNLQKRRIFRGGSTITQQLAKNIFLTPEQTLVRKIRETALAFQLEKHLTKKRILELYLNVIEWGDSVYGAEAAARFHFAVPASDLSLSQSIRLASVLPNPRRFSPLDNRTRRLNRKRHRIAYRIFRRHGISEEEYDRCLAELEIKP